MLTHFSTRFQKVFHKKTDDWEDLFQEVPNETLTERPNSTTHIEFWLSLIPIFGYYNLQIVNHSKVWIDEHMKKG